MASEIADTLQATLSDDEKAQAAAKPNRHADAFVFYLRATQISRFATFWVSMASRGAPGPGWAFTVVLAGQDGFSGDQARGFQPTPQDFQFGVCAAPSADPHCTFSPGAVPKLMDVITPTGVLQSNEVDYTLHNPVVLQGVAIS